MHYGIDIGGTKTEFAVFDKNFNRITSHRTATVTNDYSGFISSIRSSLADADEIYGKTCSVGVGVPGILDNAGRSFSVNVPCLNGKCVQKDLLDALKRPVQCINDVRAFALSEAYGGAADGFETMAGVILGTGAASGFCQRGDLNLGMNGIAGEWGHLPVASTLAEEHGLPLFPCTCGARGCLENYVSGPGLARLAFHYLGQETKPADCIALARQGDPHASKVVTVWIDCIASVLAQIILHLDPEVIVIGGGMSKVSELYERLPLVTPNHLFSGVVLPTICQAKFGDDSGVRGAAIIGSRA